MKLSELQIRQLKLWDNDNYFWKETVAIREWLSFEEARDFIHSLKLKNVKEWNKYCKSGNKPNNIPWTPSEVYKNKGWISWGDWLGTGYVKNKEFLPFEEAKEFIRSLNLKNYNDWYNYCKSGDKPNNIPSAPNQKYKDWMSMSDWLGNGKLKIEFLSFEKSREFAHSLKLKGNSEWREYCKLGNKPNNIPANPDVVYKDWISWGDWIGTGAIASQNKIYLSFEEARKFARSLNLKNQKEWNQYHKPDNIPSNPDKNYKNLGWISLGDWLGTGYVYKKDFLSFKEAREFVHSLKLKNVKEWNKYCKSGNKPNNIPSAPDKNYKDLGWISFGDWLGIEKISNQNKGKLYFLFEKAREFARSLNLKSVSEWKEYCKLNKLKNMPTNPNRTYKENWISWRDWLGK